MGWYEHPPNPTIDKLDDNQVIALVRENSDMFKVLYERYFHRIYSYCLKRTNNVQMAEDLSSEVFINVFKKLDSYKGGYFTGWLFRIAHNVVVDHYRKHKKVVAIDNIPLQNESHMTNIIAHQLFIEEILSELDESEREILMLRLDAELSAPEIARLTGKSANAVRVQIYRLLKRLRERHGAIRRENDDS